MTNDEQRAQFEAWIARPPFEKSIARYDERGSWPGNYCARNVQLAWDAWQDAQQVERDACACLAEETAAGRDAESIADAIRARGDKA